jgi:F-type H+-transporting ATPase subunit b
MFDPSVWALLALIVFFGILLYVKVPGKLAASLDKRADAIRNELEEARRLREEAQSVLAEYQRKRSSAEDEAEEIVAQARAEAERLTKETNEALEEMVERRTQAAEMKIAQAEAQAIAEVRARATDVAISAAEQILESKVTGKVADDLTKNSIDAVKANFN